MSSTLHTAGQLRAILTATLVDLREGRIDTKRAGATASLAKEINNSLLAEVAANRLRFHAGQSIAETGSLSLVDMARPMGFLAAPEKALKSYEEPAE